MTTGGDDMSITKTCGLLHPKRPLCQKLGQELLTACGKREYGNIDATCVYFSQIEPENTTVSGEVSEQARLEMHSASSHGQVWIFDFQIRERD